jgi:hypothetical protein
METTHPPLLGLGAVLAPESEELATRQRDAFNHAALAYSEVTGACVPEAMHRAIDTYLRVMREGVHNETTPA